MAGEDAEAGPEEAKIRKGMEEGNAGRKKWLGASKVIEFLLKQAGEGKPKAAKTREQ